MNAKVKEFIASAKEQQLAQEKKKKDEILIKLGLYEEEIITSDKQEDLSYHFDYDERYWYKKTKKPIELTDKEYEEVLKYYVEDVSVEDKHVDVPSANGLRVWRGILMAIAIIGAIAFFILGAVEDSGWFIYIPCISVSILPLCSFLAAIADITEAVVGGKK